MRAGCSPFSTRIFDGPGDEYVVHLRPVLQSFFERRRDEWRIVDRQFLADWSRVDVGIQEWVGDDIGSPFVNGSSDRHDPSYSRAARTL